MVKRDEEYPILNNPYTPSTDYLIETTKNQAAAIKFLKHQLKEQRQEFDKSLDEGFEEAYQVLTEMRNRMGDEIKSLKEKIQIMNLERLKLQVMARNPNGLMVRNPIDVGSFPAGTIVG